MYYLGIDMGATNIKAGLIDEYGNIIYKESRQTYSNRSYSKIIKDVADLALNVISIAGKDLNVVSSIGIGVPGIPVTEDGTLIGANNLKDNNIPLIPELRKHINLPIVLENDANCAALAEGLVGSAQKTKHSVTVTLGTGIGCGIIINGKIYAGINNAAGEMGHMVIISGGKACTCGRNGCWEVYASANALMDQAKHAAQNNPRSLLTNLVNNDIDQISSITVFNAYQMGDQVAKKIIYRYIQYLSEGIINIINIFQPEVIVIGGGLSQQKDILLELLKKTISQNICFKESIIQTRIEISNLGNDAGIIGAALFAKGGNV